MKLLNVEKGLKKNISSKKIIIPILLILVMSFSVLSWEASRAISGYTVTITIDPSEGTGYFTIQETLNGPAVAQPLPSQCGLAVNKLTCDYDSSAPGTIVYQTTGSGTVAGVIVGGYPSESKTIGGDSTIPKTVVTVCAPYAWFCEGATRRKQCTSLGLGYSALQDCPPDTPICVNGVCQAILPQCGNNLQEGNEVCDGTALADQTCITLGFASGTLACAANCLSFDTNLCVAAEEAPPLGPLGQQIEQAVEEERAAQQIPAGGKPSWTTNLISRIASILKSWFGG